MSKYFNAIELRLIKIYRVFVLLLKSYLDLPVKKRVSLNKILLGGENDLPGYQYALMTGDFMRPSTLVSLGPHASLLRDYQLHGESIFDTFESTGYYKNAQHCIDLFGDYFPGIDSDSKIILAAKRFVGLWLNHDVSHLPSHGHSRDGALIELLPIDDSDCYQLRQGNHRVAFAVADGKEHIEAKILLRKKQITPVQFLLKSLSWEKGEKVIYQPLPCPELVKQWTLARRCDDRLSRMLSFLEVTSLPFSTKILDLGSYYGWFVSQFRHSGYNAFGVEKDNIPILIGSIAYGNLEGFVFKDDIVRYLNNTSQCYDVICCLSIMHHMINQREKSDPLELLQLIDKKTSRILFFEMGQEHEAWFSESLKGWNPDKIENWILGNSSFMKVTRLGADEDGTGKFKGNFGRMLFAFEK